MSSNTTKPINNFNSQSARQDGAAVEVPANSISFIGEFAGHAGVSPMTVRFYEREGLLSPRRIGRLRTYGEEDERRLRVILMLRRIGLSIAKIREALEVAPALNGGGDGAGYTQLLQGHFADLCRKRNEIALQLVRTGDILAGLGKCVDETAAGHESNQDKDLK